MSYLSKIIASTLVVLALLLTALALYLMAKPSAEPTQAAPISTSTPTTETPPPPLYAVVVTRGPLKAGTMLSEDNIKIEQWPIQPEHSFADIEALKGRHLRTDLATGELLQESLLMKGLAYYLEPGERAITIPIQGHNAHASRIEAGDYVDIFFFLKRQSNEVDASQARLLLAKKRVLALGPQSIDGPILDNNRSNTDLNNTAVLAIPLEEVNPLLIAAREGTLQLVVRSPLDEGMPDPSLFPPRSHVLNTKENLSNEQSQALKTPENQAFAGVNLSEVSASEGLEKTNIKRSNSNIVSSRATPAPQARSIEIIRGPNLQHEHY